MFSLASHFTIDQHLYKCTEREREGEHTSVSIVKIEVALWMSLRHVKIAIILHDLTWTPMDV